MEMEELKKKLAEKEKGATKEMDNLGVQLAAMSQKVEGLIKVVDDILAKKPN